MPVVCYFVTYRDASTDFVFALHLVSNVVHRTKCDISEVMFLIGPDEELGNSRYASDEEITYVKH
jgi:hypothetical protein